MCVKAFIALECCSIAYMRPLGIGPMAGRYRRAARAVLWKPILLLHREYCILGVGYKCRKYSFNADEYLVTLAR